MAGGGNKDMEAPRGGSFPDAALDVHDVHVLGRLQSINTMQQYTVPEDPKEAKRPLLVRAFKWWAAWSVPGLGMFSEAYIIFSIGLIKPLLAAMHPFCFDKHTECSNEETHVANYVQIAGIICGMLFFGALGDVIGRCWGSRIVASIMLTGSIMLVFSPLIPKAITFLHFFIFAQTFYGFGVGGEYPMASASAAERSQSDPRLRNKRGQQVVLTFSQQGMGNFVNGCIIVIFLALFRQTGPKLDGRASRDIIMIQFAVAAAVSVFMTLWRYFKLKESAVWKAERDDAVDINAHVQHKQTGSIYKTAFSRFWPRLFVTSGAWVANDFAFYGNKLFQSQFIAALYPNATPFERMQWTVLNSAISLTGYWTAAALVDKPWYGRRRMQTIGFMMMFVLFLICGVAYPKLTASPTGFKAFQALYFLSSYFNQFGPNCTTWLVAAESYPTDVRATFQGISAAWGKVGAIIADIVFGYVSTQMTFYMSAAAGIIGAIMTVIFLPETTGLSLDEIDRMNKYMLTNEFEHYHGPAVDPKHLSLWERWVLKWDKHHDPALDAAHRKVQSMASMASAKGFKDAGFDTVPGLHGGRPDAPPHKGAALEIPSMVKE